MLCTLWGLSSITLLTVLRRLDARLISAIPKSRFAPLGSAKSLIQKRAIGSGSTRLTGCAGLTHVARSNFIADWLILKPLPLATVQFTEPVVMTHVKGPERTRVPGEKSGVPSPGFEPH